MSSSEANPVPRSISRPVLETGRLREAFFKVRTFVHSVTGKFESTKPVTHCPEIGFFRRTSERYLGSRSFMHTGHRRGSICMVRQAALLSDSHLVGLLLHEFGHLGGGHGEPEANRWVLNKLGIEIDYRAPLDIQWVPAETARKILS